MRQTLYVLAVIWTCIAQDVLDVAKLPWEEEGYDDDGTPRCGWVVKYYHPECGGCRLVEGPYHEAAKETVRKCGVLKVNCKEHPEYCMEKGAVEYPHIVYYSNERKVTAGPLDVFEITDADELRRMIEKFIVDNCNAGPGCSAVKLLPHKAKKPHTAVTSQEENPQLKVWVEDLRRGLYEALAAYKVKDGHEDAKRLLVNLAKVTFPEEDVRENLSLDNYKFLIDSPDGRYKKWYGCAGSALRFRGLPCALWQLFHTMSIACLGVECKGELNPLHVIREWVVGYYNCKVCRVHFEEDTKKWVGGTYTPPEAVLLVWEAHNEVTLRIQGDATDDPTHPKTFFPSPALCPACYPSLFSSKTSPKAVLEFLLEYYPTHITHTPPSLNLPFQEEEALATTWLYLTVTATSLFLTLHLWRRKRYILIRIYRRMLGGPVLPV